MRRWLPWVAVAALLLVGWQVVKLHLHHDWAQAQQVKDLRHANDSLHAYGVTLDTVYLTDTLRLTTIRTRYDTLWQQVAAGDTNKIRPLTLAADSTIHACSEALQTCEAQKSNLRAQVANVQAQLALEKKSHPGWLSRTLTKVTWAGIGFGAAKILSR